MEFPIEIQKLINDYSKPITRNDWIKGSYINRKIGNRSTTLKGYLQGEVLMRATRISHTPNDYDDSTILFYFNDLLFQHGEENDD